LFIYDRREEMPADSIKVSVLGTEKEVPINVREYYSILDAVCQ
jgi:hypothetical protein